MTCILAELVSIILIVQFLSHLDDYDAVGRRGNADLGGLFGVGKTGAKPKKKTTASTRNKYTTGPSSRTRPATKSRITAGGPSKSNSELAQKYSLLKTQIASIREILNIQDDPSLLVEELRTLLDIDIPTPVSNV